MRKKPTRPAELTDEQRPLYEKIAQGPRAAESAFPLTDENCALTGPFDAMLLVPAIGDALQAVGAALRFGGRLTPRARETAILFVGHHHASAFEVSSHEAVARRIGMSDQELADIAAGRPPETADDYERAITAVVTELLTDAGLDDAGYRTAVRELGEPLLFELSTLVGYYSLLAVQLRLFG